MNNEEFPKIPWLDEGDLTNDNKINKQRDVTSENISDVLSVKKNPKVVSYIDIRFVNHQLIHLKELLHYRGWTFTPENIDDFVAKILKKYIVDKKVFSVMDELNYLLHKECFDLNIKTNIPWIRVINFLNQLNVAFDIKREQIYIKIWKKPITVVEEPERNITSVHSYSLYQTTVTFDALLEEADEYFRMTGPIYFPKAKEKYKEIIQKFPNDKHIGYVQEKLKEVTELIKFMFTPLKKEASSNLSANQKPSNIGDIDPKTGRKKNDISFA